MSVQDSRIPTVAPARSILIAVDGSPASGRALAYVSKIAPAGARIAAVSVADNPRTLVPTTPLVDAELEAARKELLQDAHNAVAQAHEVFAGQDVILETAVIDLAREGGDIARALASEANRRAADLLVVGARQHHGLLRWVEGTVSEPLAALARRPLLIVPEGYTAPIEHAPKRIVFPVDGSETSAKALQYGSTLAAPDAQLRAVYVIDRAVRLTDFVPVHLLEDAFRDEGKAALATAARILSSVTAQSSTAMIETGRTADDVAHAIVRDALHWQADLVVMGTHGRRGIARWFVGSVAGRVARIAQTPLLLVPAALA
ncbi:universal stress protein [Trinickia caryophylli]|uniref:Nucleotide-binding universal stress protein, UspA family n=2 Tax=Trinickia caryophylli TaxID=28094 RepID=A0A1X7H9K1_TRICW|nr:universal stress protein [Trinickia caryophylli]PMS09004.1 universal stress protein [Trinickia caryophylli]TRX15030.1 universal stress protein [Trinickia caryophylli]WQE14887.1 universal stress protein [Trinickia caryophylli]SMF82127.1 Nucleotide-binding universal stress protein, UspA family [Trinickia caryophylli]GLU35784.1 universal stress family protein [Trinickia caryophylli]